VQISARGRGFAINVEGRALTSGREGHPARVRTESGRVVVGQPVGERRVELAL
jgi:flagella basal body P-ring formation protein FlgA